MIEPKTKTWVLIADGAHARIVENQGRGTGLNEPLDHEFAASHAPSRDINTDRPGRNHKRGGIPGVGGATAPQRHGYQARTDPHELEKERFAKDLADLLAREADRGSFDELVVVAPPQILGIMRDHLAQRVRQRLRQEINKDLTHVPVHDLPRHLEGVVPL